jgi:uncharacterized damage-inducible protein DinB
MARMSATRPQPEEYGRFYDRYVANVPEQDDIIAVMERQRAETQALLAQIGEEQSTFRYAEGKWSIKGIVGHLTDGERVFSYRLLAIARGDQSPLPSFDEERYAATAGFDDVPFAELVSELDGVRRSTLALMRHLPSDAWTRTGSAAGYPVSVRALAWVMVGHERHHLSVLRERYHVA